MRASRQINGFYIAFALLVLANAVYSPAFFTLFNLNVVLSSSASLLLLAAGLTLVIMTGRIDISVGSTMFLSGGVFVVLQEQGMPMVLAFLAVMVLGALLGALNGLLIAYAGLSALLTTLGMMLVVRGLGLKVIGGKQHALPQATEALRQIDIFGVPLYVVAAVALTVLMQWGLVSTFVGRRVVAIGCSPASAAKLGIPIRFYVFGVYVAAGLLSALAGVVSILNLGGVQTYLGKGQEFVGIAAVVIGGVSLFGGTGSVIPGALIGVLFLVIVDNGLNLAGVSPFAFPFLTGVVILIAMYAHTFSDKRTTEGVR